MEISDAHMNRIIFDIFLKHYQSSEIKLLLLFGLNVISESLDWYLTNDIITNNLAFQIKEQKKIYCRELIIDLNKIIEKFNIPDLFTDVPLLNLPKYVGKL